MVGNILFLCYYLDGIDIDRRLAIERSCKVK